MLRTITVILAASALISVNADPSRSNTKNLKRDYGYGYGYASPEGQGAPAGSYAKYPEDSAVNAKIDNPSSDTALAQQPAQPTTSNLPGSDQPTFTQTGIGAKLVSSFTVTDLATLLTPSIPIQANVAGNAPTTTQATSDIVPTPLSAPFSVDKPVGLVGNVITGVNARVVLSTTVGVQFIAIATGTGNNNGASSATWSSQAAGATDIASSVGAPQPGVSSGQQSSGAAATVTGINAAARGFVTITTSIDFAALTAPSSTPSATVAAQAMNADSQGVEMPGQKLSVLPIGLGVLGGLILLGLTVVGYVTYERSQYRKQFRRRKAMENLQNADSMRQSIIRRRG